MDGYILRELLLPFLFGVGVFSSLGVSVGALFELIRRLTEAELTFPLAAQILLLRLPQFVAYAFPMSMLLAALMTYSRLSSDSELVALKGCGISVARLILPAVFLSLVVTGVTFAFNEFIVPAANYRATLLYERAIGEEKPTFREKNIFYQEFQTVGEGEDKERELSRLFYAKEFDGRTMKGLTILDFSREGLSQIVSAQAAQWNEPDSTWDFVDGTIYVVSSDGSFRNILKFDQQQLPLPRTPLDFASEDRNTDEMNIVETARYRELVAQSGDDAKVRRLSVRMQNKMALPFACLTFGLVGGVLGTRPQRANRATSFAVSVVMIFGYYLMSAVTMAIAETGTISPFLGAWLPNICGVLAGILLLMRFSR
ncbi:LptF/LptG family permease [Microcoleus sp. FACHB-1515]|nr:LptF/LptG family permease [Microcoleus sp. FACHB-1515]